MNLCYNYDGDIMGKDNLKYYTYELDIGVLNILAILLFLVLFLLMYLLGYDLAKLFLVGDIVVILVLLVFWLMLHEVLHGIGFSIFKSVDRKNVVYGMALEKGVFYCMCKQKIRKNVIFAALLFPLIIIGVITLIIGCIINSYLLMLLSILNIMGSIGDIMMSIYFYKCPDDVIYLDLDDCTSFTVLSKKDLSGIKVMGIKLKENGIYNNEMVPKIKDKLVISRKSWYVLIVIFILMLIKVIGGVL